MIANTVLFCVICVTNKSVSFFFAFSSSLLLPLVFGLIFIYALRPGQQFFSHVGMEPSLPNKYFGVLNVFLLDGSSWDLTPKSDALPLSQRAPLYCHSENQRKRNLQSNAQYDLDQGATSKFG